MKTLLLCLILCLSVTNQLSAQKIKIKGSDTMLPLTQMLAEEFMKRNIDASIIISGGGSVTGITALLDGTTDIAESARDLNADEKLNLKKADKQIIETTIAYDALAVIVNPANKVSQLTMQQIQGIFTGIISNWKEVGGIDSKIVVFSRGTSSGTYDFFIEHVLNNKRFTPTSVRMPATGAIAQSVSQDKNAIGYVGLGYLDKTVKAIQVSADNGKSFSSPSVETVINKTYPISRPLFYMYPESIKDAISPFIEFALSVSGQKLILKTGYVPVK